MMRAFLSFFMIFALVMATSVPPAFAERDEDNGYTGPRQMTSAETNVTGGCNCGTTMSGSAASSALSFAPILGMLVMGAVAMSSGQASETVDDITENGQVAVAELYQTGTDYYVDITAVHPEGVIDFIDEIQRSGASYQVILSDEMIAEGETIDLQPLTSQGISVSIRSALQLPYYYGYENLYINQVIYEDLVAVVEIERHGNDLYIRIDEVRASDVTSFIANQNQPENTYQVIMAMDYLAAEGSSSEFGTVSDGYDIRNVQMIELPPEDTYEFVFFVEPNGTTTNITGATADLAAAEDEDNLDLYQ